jgi:NPCBM/NEW2 domain
VCFGFRCHTITTATLVSAVWLVVSASAVDVVVRTVDESEIAGRLVSLTLDDGLIIDLPNRARRTLPIDNVVSIEAEEDVTRATSAPFVVGLGWAARSDRVLGTPVSYERDGVVMNSPLIGMIWVPLDRVTHWECLRDNRLDSYPPRDNVAEFLVQSADDSDVLLLANGDSASGFILEIDSEGFVVDTGDSVQRLTHDRIAAVRFLGVPRQDDASLSFAILLADGSRITTPRLDIDDDSARIELYDGSKRSIDCDVVARVDVRGGRWAWLTDLRPAEVSETAMMETDWPYWVDRNVVGGPLSVDGQLFDRGFGVHSRSELRFDLGGGFSEFVTRYGVDDDSGPLADVTVRIVVDGRVVYEQSSVRRGTLHRPPSIRLDGARQLDLVVDFGRLGSVQDRFDWIEAAVVR